MLMSMTGYGKREVQNNDIALSVEIKSVNSRYMEVSHKIPRLFFEDEDVMLNMIRRKLVRGKIIFNINYQILNENLNKISLDENKLAQLLKITNNLKRNSGVKGNVSIDKLLSFPDIIVSSTSNSSLSYKRLLSKCLNDAIDDLVKMRTKEGRNLKNDILIRLGKIKKYLKSIVLNTSKVKKDTFTSYKKKILDLSRDNNSNIILDDNN